MTTMRVNSWNGTHAPRAFAGTAEFKPKVSEPVMNAVDAMPKAYRDLVNEFDYVDVYRAWRRGMSTERIRAIALANGGRFEL